MDSDTQSSETVAVATNSARAVTGFGMNQLRMIGACRKKVGNQNGGDLLVYVICLEKHDAEYWREQSGLSSERSPIRLDRAAVMKYLGLSLNQYKTAVTALKTTGLIEWRHKGGRAKAWVCLSLEGAEWARTEGLLLGRKKHDAAASTDRLSNKDDAEVPSK